MHEKQAVHKSTPCASLRVKLRWFTRLSQCWCNRAEVTSGFIFLGCFAAGSVPGFVHLAVQRDCSQKTLVDAVTQLPSPSRISPSRMRLWRRMRRQQSDWIGPQEAHWLPRVLEWPFCSASPITLRQRISQSDDNVARTASVSLPNDAPGLSFLW